MSRQYTNDEVRELLVKQVWGMVKYWGGLPDKTTEDRLSGLAFSILSLLDGSNVGIPGFVVAPYPHPEDKEYHKANGENWFPETPEVDSDIGGSLHECFCKVRK